MTEPEMRELKGEMCPFCQTKNLTLTESEMDIPFFGKVFVFTMACSKCKHHKSDVEAAEQKEPAQYALEITSAKDMAVRVIRSSEGTILLDGIGSMTPGEDAQGFVTNVEGILVRMRDQVEFLRDHEEDEGDKAKAQAHIDRINRVIAGNEKLLLTVKDPTGNSAIISDRAVKKKLGRA